MSAGTSAVLAEAWDARVVFVVVLGVLVGVRLIYLGGVGLGSRQAKRNQAADRRQQPTQNRHAAGHSPANRFGRLWLGVGVASACLGLLVLAVGLVYETQLSDHPFLTEILGSLVAFLIGAPITVGIIGHFVSPLIDEERRRVRDLGTMQRQVTDVLAPINRMLGSPSFPAATWSENFKQYGAEPLPPELSKAYYFAMEASGKLGDDFASKFRTLETAAVRGDLKRHTESGADLARLCAPLERVVALLDATDWRSLLIAHARPTMLSDGIKRMLPNLEFDLAGIAEVEDALTRFPPACELDGGSLPAVADLDVLCEVLSRAIMKRQGLSSEGHWLDSVQDLTQLNH